ncbi:MAG: hypothetical protein LC780_10825 [Acidobacteria bacterium]|nr:hypothetical protein [Acidobacteriota bacterium]
MKNIWRPRGPVSRRLLIAAAAVSALLASGRAPGQDDDAAALTERSAIVVRAKVVKANASNEPMVAASPGTAVTRITKMYAGSEIAGDQTGKTATVILSRPGSLKAGQEATFFGNPRFMGKTLTIADEGEIASRDAASRAAPSIERHVQARRDKPVVERLASATLVFRGVVETVRPLAAADAATGESKPYPTRPSEHDPDWQVATVKVVKPLRGEAGPVVTVVFPASRDIVWFNVPKLRQGQDSIFITHALSPEEAARHRASGLVAFMDKQPAHVIIEPSDVLPPGDEARVRGLLSAPKEVK